MHQLSMLWDGVWKVLLAGIILGAGLPALFSVGIKAMAYGVGGDAEESHEVGHPIGRVLGYLCFGLVLLFIAMGIAVIVSSGLGYEFKIGLTELPHFVKKKH